MRVILSGLDFRSPVEGWAPTTVRDALNALDRADEALDHGYWIAGALSYEFGAFLNGVPSRSTGMPLLLLGVFERPNHWRADGARNFRMAPPLTRIDRSVYSRNVEAIVRRIYDGDVYQVNYTIPFDIAFADDPLELYRLLGPTSGARYQAFLKHESVTLVSLSPELFLEFADGRITAKPMKGTAPLDSIDALANEKNRAEHLMIVDLVRNDLNRLGTGVRVDGLFSLERYPTFATLTSTISAFCDPSTPFTEVLRATFPCGSVTGAPKLAAMQHIRQLEPEPRGFYTGSIGFLSPQRRGWWNVAIRTLQFPTGAISARFDAGGGIVSDSVADDEWQEVLLKSRFLRPAVLDFALLETMRSGPDGSDVGAHTRRLLASAEAFGIPLDRGALAAHITGSILEKPSLLRMKCRIDTTIEKRNDVLETRLEPVAICFSTARVRSDDPMLRHKTTWRPSHDIAAEEAAERSCFDALLRNERDEITEGARTSVFAKIDGVLYTPPLECGVLPGILRTELLASGAARERVLCETDLLLAEDVYVGNSARGLLRAALLKEDSTSSPFKATSVCIAREETPAF